MKTVTIKRSEDYRNVLPMEEVVRILSAALPGPPGEVPAPDRIMEAFRSGYERGREVEQALPYKEPARELAARVVQVRAANIVAYAGYHDIVLAEVNRLLSDLKTLGWPV